MKLKFFRLTDSEIEIRKQFVKAYEERKDNQFHLESKVEGTSRIVTVIINVLIIISLFALYILKGRSFCLTEAENYILSTADLDCVLGLAFFFINAVISVFLQLFAYEGIKEIVIKTLYAKKIKEIGGIYTYAENHKDYVKANFYNNSIEFEQFLRENINNSKYSILDTKYQLRDNDLFIDIINEEQLTGNVIQSSFQIYNVEIIKNTKIDEPVYDLYKNQIIIPFCKSEGTI